MSPISLHPRSSHDVTALLADWQAVAREAGMSCTELLQVEEWSVPAYRTRAAERGDRAIYLSTGVHGDESGSAQGLLAWAQANIGKLRHEPFVICPCLNPMGLANNTRADHRGLDINRRFHLQDDPLMAAWQTWVKQVPLSMGLCLHEDFDTHGTYVYELSDATDRPHVEDVMQRVELIIPRDMRPEIEGQPACCGILQRREVPVQIEGPEAIVLYQVGCPLTLTFETPSEFALEQRVRAQITFIESALEYLAPHRA